MSDGYQTGTLSKDIDLSVADLFQQSHAKSGKIQRYKKVEQVGDETIICEQ